MLKFWIFFHGADFGVLVLAFKHFFHLVNIKEKCKKELIFYDNQLSVNYNFIRNNKFSLKNYRQLIFLLFFQNKSVWQNIFVKLKKNRITERILLRKTIKLPFWKTKQGFLMCWCQACGMFFFSASAMCGFSACVTFYF